jgi:type II secretory pathway component PulJ
MKRPVRPAQSRSRSAGPPPAYTLVEILVATALTLIMVAAVVQIFGSIGESVSESRATLEMSDRVRAVRTRLEMDLAGITATMLPPLRPEAAEGYFEYIEGPVGPVIPPSQVAKNMDDPSNPMDDTTVGDFDDILMFTTRSQGRPFLGRCAVTGETIESDVAEVAWFLRGRTLYRRVMLVAPGVDLSSTLPPGFFANNDLSVRPEFDPSGRPAAVVANTLGDLTKRECRYAHRLLGNIGFPFDARIWGQLGLPTLRECSSPAWFNWDNNSGLPGVAPVAAIDLWNNPHPWYVRSDFPSGPAGDAEYDDSKRTGTLMGYKGLRVAEDVILTNVIGFDVKAWDPGAPVLRGVSDNDTPLDLGDDTVLPDVVVVPGDAGYPLALAHLMEELSKPPANRNQNYLPLSYGAYADLHYSASANLTYGVGTYDSAFAGPGDSGSKLHTGAARVYDTWSSHYEDDGIDQDNDGVADEGTNGFDDNGNGIVDDPGEMETSPPYPVPLQAIQVKIRVYEPDSRQIREVTVVQDFLPK